MRILLSLIFFLLVGSVFADNILVAVAHQDDETIGAAGIIRRHILQGDNVSILLFTDGAPGDNETASSIRNKEMKDIMSTINITSIKTLNYDDLGFIFDLSKKEFKELVEVLSKEYGDYDIIYTHAYEHGHIDHDGVSYIMSKVKGNFQLKVFHEYSHLGFNQTIENFTILNMSKEELRIKKEMLCMYESQELTNNCSGEECCKSLLDTYYTGKDRVKNFPGYDYTKSPCENDSCRWENHHLGWENFYNKIETFEYNWFERLLKWII